LLWIFFQKLAVGSLTFVWVYIYLLLAD